MNVVTLKTEMKAYAIAHKLVLPKVMWKSRVWGKGAKTLAWRVTGYMHPTKQTDSLPLTWAMFHPPTPAEALRQRIVAGYVSILGAREGGTIQHAIAKFCGISDREPWCAETLKYVLQKLAGYNGPMPDNPAYVPSWELFAKAKNILVSFRDALPGMAATMVWSGAHGIAKGQHIGVLVKCGLMRHTIQFSALNAEGNAGGAGGDAVREVTRWWFQYNVIFDVAKLQK
jgi:hypothetical protein